MARDYKAAYARQKARLAALGTTPALQRKQRALARGATPAGARGHGAGELHADRVTLIRGGKRKDGSTMPSQWVAGPYVHRPPTKTDKGAKPPPPLSRARRVKPEAAIRAIQGPRSPQVAIAVWGQHQSGGGEFDWKVGRVVARERVAQLRDIIHDLRTLRTALTQQALTSGMAVPGRVSGPLPLAQQREIDRIVLRAEYEAMNEWATSLMRFDGEYKSVFRIAVARSEL